MRIEIATTLKILGTYHGTLLLAVVCVMSEGVGVRVVGGSYPVVVEGAVHVLVHSGTRIHEDCVLLREQKVDKLEGRTHQHK